MKSICWTILLVLPSTSRAAVPQQGEGVVPSSQGPAAERQASQEPQGTQDPGAGAESPAAGQVPPQQLEQLVAPIALYPDALLAQVLMASTYPLEIVEAARWVKTNPGLAGDKLEAALKDQTWDPSVKSMCGFPDVLARMNDNLDWMQDLGDAFLGQKEAVMNSVQTMRRKAYEAGNLKSSKELTVTEQSETVIVVEAADPQVIYVPTYTPTAVYGSWGYPSYYYPPLYPPPPPGGMFFSFTAGVVWGAAVWGDCDWGHTDVDIDIDRYNNFVDNTEIDARKQQVKDRAGEGGGWQHDPAHRGGVGYKDGKVAQQYGASPGQSRVSRDQARGYSDRSAQRPSASTGDRASTRPSAPAGARTTGGTSPATREGPSARTQGRDAPSQRPAPTTRGSSARPTGQGSGSFSGSRSPSFDRAGSSRGAASRGSAGARGGGSRGGGRRGGR